MEAIVYYLQLTVTDDPRSRAQIEKLRQLIEQSGAILSDAVHYLQSAPPRPEPLDLHEALADCLGRLAPLDQHKLELDLVEPAPVLRFDRSQMQHLMAAALRFYLRVSRRSHPVAVSTCVENGNVILAFTTDIEGTEIHAPEDLFAPFEDHPAAAAGLGLASIRRIAQTHRGSCHLLKGSGPELTLRVELPL
jgi:two-component system sensor histidine kinase KdpD